MTDLDELLSKFSGLTRRELNEGVTSGRLPLDDLVEAWGSGDEKDSLRIAGVLDILGLAIVGPLLHMLRDPRSTVREPAMALLRYLKIQLRERCDLVTDLRKMLSDPEIEVRIGAIEAAAEFGEYALQRQIAGMQSDTDIRVGAAARSALQRLVAARARARKDWGALGLALITMLLCGGCTVLGVETRLLSILGIAGDPNVPLHGASGALAAFLILLLLIIGMILGLILALLPLRLYLTREEMKRFITMNHPGSDDQRHLTQLDRRVLDLLYGSVEKSKCLRGD